jgi:hypothetical protein
MCRGCKGEVLRCLWPRSFEYTICASLEDDRFSFDGGGQAIEWIKHNDGSEIWLKRGDGLEIRVKSYKILRDMIYRCSKKSAKSGKRFIMTQEFIERRIDRLKRYINSKVDDVV